MVKLGSYLLFALYILYAFSCSHLADFQHNDSEASGGGAPNLQTSTPAMSPPGGTYSSDQGVGITCGTSGASIYYTINGSEPTTNSTAYTSPIAVNGQGTALTIKAIAVQAGLANSPVRSESYIINYSQVSTPAMGTVGGMYNSDQNVAITCGTTGATIYYTTNGTTPTAGSTLYTGPVPIAGHDTVMTIKAIAVKTGMLNSTIRTESYSIQYDPASTPALSPSGGTYSSDQSVSITCGTSGATIHYTTDGTAPTSGSPTYSGAIPVAGHGTTMMVKAIAVKTGMLDSAVCTASYSIQYNTVVTPVMTPSSGTYSADQNVAITCGTSGATIHYTTDGSAPTSGSATYTGTISVAGHGTSMTVKAIAMKAGMLDSPVQTGVYTINYNQVSTPTLSPLAGTYNSDQSVSISCGTSGASIYYTMDGSTPTTGSTAYTGPISVAGSGSSKTIKAIAVKAGMSDSSVQSGAYTIQYDPVATPVISPFGGTYNSDQSVSISCGTGGATIHYTTDGTTPTSGSTTYTTPISVAGHGTSMTIKAIAVKAGMVDSSVQSESFTIQYSTVATPFMNPVGGTFDLDQSVGISCGTSGAVIHYTTDGSTPTSGSTVYTGPISVAGQGTSMTIKAVAVKSGMLDSAVRTETYTIQYDPVATPVMTPVSGTFNADQNVYITCGTVGAAIHYTTDGSTPTSGSTAYTGAIPVAGHGTSKTIKAIAVKSGLPDSAIKTESYTIQYDPVATPVITPAGGTYTSVQNVSISCGTGGATIYYTTNGTTPTTGSTLYTGSITIGTSVTVKAIAVRTGMLDSAVQSETYTLNIPPVPGNSGIITASSVLWLTLTLNWTKATDNETPQSSLQYLVYYSASPNIDTVANIIANGTAFGSYSTDINTKAVTGLATNTVYYFNVIVKDASGNMSAYTMFAQKTLADFLSYDAFYNFSGDVKDGSANKYDLTTHAGSGYTTNRAGTVNTAYKCFNTFLDLHDTAALDYSNKMSVSVWIRTTNATVPQAVLGKSPSGYGAGYILSISNSHVLVEVWDTGGAYYKIDGGAVTIPSNTWTHLAFTWKTGEKFRSYVNGALDKEISASTSPIASASKNPAVGADPSSTTQRRFMGAIDDIRLYSDEFWQTDVQYLYNLPAD